MRVVNEINVPETLGEAREMTYKQLEEACKVFNNHGLSAEEIKKAWDKNWWDGFDAAIEMVMKSLEVHDEGSLFTVNKFIDEFKDSLIEEVDLYKKDG